MKTPTRRQFLTTSAAVVGTASLPLTATAHVGGSDELRVGLIGCGGRGTGAASQALKADKNVKLVAMGDMFGDRLESCHKQLNKIDAIEGKVDVPTERRFVGFDAYKQVIAADVDVVLLTTPPHFRPFHLETAVAAGKHVFAEKPCAVDAQGVRRVLAACEQAKKKSLSVVSGLCLRFSNGFGEVVKRINDGEIGDVQTLYANDYRGLIWHHVRQDDWTDMHWQMRNWYYFTWLSGDFNVEQHVHFLDVCAWAKGNEYPVSAIGMGGRQARTGMEFGNIYDHHSVIYEFADGAKLHSNTRQMSGCTNQINASVVGSKGSATFSERRNGLSVVNDKTWSFDEKDNDVYQTEHDELFASIREGKPINNGEYMAKSTLLAIMGRMATYTGKRVTWQQALESKEDLTPAAYAWGDAPEVVIATPGITKLI